MSPSGSVYSGNDNGPRKLPCGTPEQMSCFSDKRSPRLTEKKFQNQPTFQDDWLGRAVLQSDNQNWDLIESEVADCFRATTSSAAGCANIWPKPLWDIAFFKKAAHLHWNYLFKYLTNEQKVDIDLQLTAQSSTFYVFTILRTWLKTLSKSCFKMLQVYYSS